MVYFASFFIFLDKLMYMYRFRISGVRTYWLDYIKEQRALEILVFCLGGIELPSHQVEVPWIAIKKFFGFPLERN